MSLAVVRSRGTDPVGPSEPGLVLGIAARDIGIGRIFDEVRATDAGLRRVCDRFRLGGNATCRCIAAPDPPGRTGMRR